MKPSDADASTRVAHGKDAVAVARPSVSRVKLAAIQQEIAAGRIAGALELSNEDAIGYDEHGLPS